MFAFSWSRGTFSSSERRIHRRISFLAGLFHGENMKCRLFAFPHEESHSEARLVSQSVRHCQRKKADEEDEEEEKEEIFFLPLAYFDVY